MAEATAPPKGKTIDFERMRRDWEALNDGAAALERVPWLTYKGRMVAAILRDHDWEVHAVTGAITLYPKGSLK